MNKEKQEKYNKLKKSFLRSRIRNAPVSKAIANSIRDTFREKFGKSFVKSDVAIEEYQILTSEQEEFLGKFKNELEWIVDIKGAPNEYYQISVCRSSNFHGRKSYGWMDENKIHISCSGGPCNYTLSEKVWEKMLKLAQELADELNEKEKLEPVT